MIRFIRNLLLTLLALLAIAYGAAWYFADDIIDRMQGPLTDRLVTAFKPDEDAEYSFEVGIRLWPPMVEIRNLSINADSLWVDGDIFQDAKFYIDKIECEIIPLLRYEEVEITLIEGRRFEGLLTNSRLADRLECESESLTDLMISEHDGRCHITGKFGFVSVLPMTLIGDWEIDDRRVATLVNRRYHNPDGPAPAGIADIIEEKADFDVRVTLLEKEMTVGDLEYGSEGLWISIHE